MMKRIGREKALSKHDQRDRFVVLFERFVIYPIALWLVGGIIFYFFTEDFKTDELIAACMLGAIMVYRLYPSKAPSSGESGDDER